ncbi:MAG: signal peptidase II [Acidimicrobiales bacterium]
MATVIALDQVTKYWARTLDEPIDLIGSLRFNLAFNTGAAFSRIEGWGSVIVVVGVIIVAVLLRTSLSITSRAGAVCLGLVIGGALGNLIDRAVQPGDGFFGGKVTDFIDVQWWPIFNVADIALTCGGLALVLVGMRTAPGARDREQDHAVTPADGPVADGDAGPSGTA